tara:strand:+ start:135266 stop:136600 length:1335 start_codon:yes stop_codon:yes gene_type:complete
MAPKCFIVITGEVQEDGAEEDVASISNRFAITLIETASNAAISKFVLPPRVTIMTESITHRTHQRPESGIAWDNQSQLSKTVETRLGEVRTRHGRFIGGVADQVEVIEVDTGPARVLILPTRGMSIWKVESDGVRFGWDSPVAGPVHPAHVPLYDPSGLGWLEGFDELVVRCGLESNGAPEHDENGQLVFPLHGRIGNLPASSLSIEINEASGRVEVIGEVIEARLFFKRLRMRSRVRMNAGSAAIELLDDVTNDLSTTTTIQMLYHVNVGAPVLGDGATLEAPILELAPKDSLAAGEMDQWNQFGAPESGYAERVYFARLQSDDANETTAMLRSADGTNGLGVRFNTNGLPRFILWKNTGAESDGYVTGLEPATNYPNGRSYEEKEGRVVEVPSGETVSFRVSLYPLTDEAAVKEMSAKIESLQEIPDPQIHSTPRPGWTPGA